MTRGRVLNLPTAIDWEASIASDYIEGKIDLDQFEAEIEDYLRNGALPDRLFPVGLPFRREPTPR